MPTRATANHPAILFVDPDRVLVHALANTFPRHYAIGAASSLASAYQILSTMAPTLLVCELSLPDGDGLTLLQQLRAGSDTADVLLMVVTSRRSIGDKLAALRAGADEYLIKPVTPEIFANHARRLLRFRRTLY